jgi:hypothetical protein
MRLARPGILGAATLLALHVFMLAGVDIGHPHPVATAIAVDQHQVHAAPAVATPARGHSMAVGCLAMLAGLLLWRMMSAVTQRRRQPLAVKPPAAPVLIPPTPPPIELGISRI